MTSIRSSQSTDGVPIYTKGGDPQGTYADYYPAWLGNPADNVTVEGSLLDGAALGPEAVRTIIGAIRTLYEQQHFNFAGAYGETGWLEDYTVHVRGEPIGWPSSSPRTPPDNPARRRELPATQLAAALVPPSGRDGRRHSRRQVLRCQRVLKRRT